jgi:MarR family transcriptional regulator, lower aerobic nicotinate degradation pathway regulator
MRADPTEIALQALPGHLIRRLQQIAVGLFLEETAEHELTPVQFAALSAVSAAPSIDQRTLARRIGFDTSTIGGVIDRLERRGLMQRQTSPTDRRVRLLCVTDSGEKLLRDVQPLMLRAQERILGPLTPADREHFMRLLQQLVDGNAGAARAPGPDD